MIRHAIRKAAAAVTLITAAALTAGLSAGTASASAAQPAVVGSVAHGEIHPPGREDLCVTAENARAGSGLQLHLCQLTSIKTQEWSIIFIRPARTSTSGFGLACLTAHAHICIGLGTWNTRTLSAPAILYDHSTAKPAALAHNAMGLYRATIPGTGKLGYKLAATFFRNAKLTPRDHGTRAIKFGMELIFRQFPESGDLSIWRFPTFGVVR